MPALPAHSLPVYDVAAVEVVQRHQQLHKPAHHHILREVAVRGDLLLGLTLSANVGRTQQYVIVCACSLPGNLAL